MFNAVAPTFLRVNAVDFIVCHLLWLKQPLLRLFWRLWWKIRGAPDALIQQYESMNVKPLSYNEII